MREAPRVPVWLKAAYAAWMAAWLPIYWIYNGPVNFLWLCDVAIFVVAAAIWLESPLLFSSQAVSMLLVQTVWTFDFLCGLIFGFHPFGATGYMFDPEKPWWLRGMSLHHVAMLAILVWAMRRLGYDRRGLALQTALLWVVLPLSLLLADPERNLNWLWGAFGTSQTLMPPWAYLLACMAVYPLLLYLPVHFLLARFAPPARTGRRETGV